MNVKDLRNKANLSQQELADATGIPKGRINGWESGKGNPKTGDYSTLKEFFVKRGVLDAEGSDDEPGINESGLLYKHAYEGARKEITDLRQAETLTISWREELLNRVTQTDANVQSLLGGVAALLSLFSEKGKDPREILERMADHSEHGVKQILEVMSQRASEKKKS